MRALETITGHVIYNPAYTYKFQLKTTPALNFGICQLYKKKLGARPCQYKCHNKKVYKYKVPSLGTYAVISIQDPSWLVCLYVAALVTVKVI